MVNDSPSDVLRGPHGLTIRLASRRVFVGDHEADLTRTSFDLLALLLRNRGRVVPIRELAEQVWGYEEPVTRGFITTAIYRLRNQLAAAGLADAQIKAVRGVGYSIGQDESPDILQAGLSFQDAIDASPIPTLLIDPAGNIRHANRAISQVLGRPAYELCSMEPGALSPPELRARRAQTIRRVLDGQRVILRDAHLRRADGSTWSADAVLAPIEVGTQAIGIIIEFLHPALDVDSPAPDAAS